MNGSVSNELWCQSNSASMEEEKPRIRLSVPQTLVSVSTTELPSLLSPMTQLAAQWAPVVYVSVRLSAVTLSAEMDNTV